VTTDEEQLAEYFAAEETRKRDHLDKARDEAKKRGKEPFDLDRLYQLCTPRSEGYPIEKGTDNGWLEYRYYVRLKELMSLGDYATLLVREELGHITGLTDGLPMELRPKPGVYRMNLTMSLRGPDLMAVGLAVFDKKWHPTDRLPYEVTVDDRQMAPRADWLTTWGPKTKHDIDARWDDGSAMLVNKGTEIVKLNRFKLDLDLARFIDDLATIPFETAVFPTRAFYIYKGNYPDGWWRGPGLTGAHHMAGWAIALRGDAGHARLVSRRWIEHGGPWRAHNAANDTTLFQFHDLAATDPFLAWSQAKPCIDRLTYQPNLDTCGIVDVTIRKYEPKDGKYDAKTKRLEVKAGTRTVSGAEMHSACDHRYTGRIRAGKWPALESIAYIFSSEQVARAHLHELWLRELECWYEADGKRVRLDADYAPKPPAPPAWVR